MCKESINTVLLCLMLVARSALSVVVAITMGHAAGAIVATDWKNFLRQLRKFALIGIPASLVNSGIKYITSILSLRFQRRLTDRLNKNYVTGVNFYKATELPEFKIDNVDQRVTTDVEQFCEQGHFDAENIQSKQSVLEGRYSNLMKPMSNRKTRLMDSLDVQQLFRDVEDEEAWIREKEQIGRAHV